MRVFTETQKLPKWAYAITVTSAVVVFFVLFSAYQQAESTAEKNRLLWVGTLAFILVTGAFILVLRMYQYVRIDIHGLHYKYPPFQIKEKSIPMKSITGYRIRPIRFPYYGYRIGFWNILGLTPSISVVGTSKVVEISYKNHKPILVGTRKPEELLKSLDYQQKLFESE
ncbi:hypothetical protein [Ascidiimonas aurantiaca]|uniref:hypothetical protein n=1 Tax=Ascidiimonas aurantiaca TaxID=1685432 RepID=UPI0030EF83FF